MIRLTNTSLSFAGLLSVALTACAVPPAIQNPSVLTPAVSYPVAVKPAPATAMVTPSFLRSSMGNTVSLQGTFAGWTGCEESTQLTKSDWVIRFFDGPRIACAYVAGSVPAGIAPPPSTMSNGLPVAIHAVVKSSPYNGKPYLQIIPK